MVLWKIGKKLLAVKLKKIHKQSKLINQKTNTTKPGLNATTKNNYYGKQIFKI